MGLEICRVEAFAVRGFWLARSQVFTFVGLIVKKKNNTCFFYISFHSPPKRRALANQSRPRLKAVTLLAHCKCTPSLHMQVQTIKPWLNNQAFSSSIVFVAHNIGWFDQTSSKISPHDCMTLLKLWRDVT